MTRTRSNVFAVSKHRLSLPAPIGTSPSDPVGYSTCPGNSTGIAICGLKAHIPPNVEVEAAPKYT
jgi:hypothetical protein